jgi:hypothetical protein
MVEIKGKIELESEKMVIILVESINNVSTHEVIAFPKSQIKRVNDKFFTSEEFLKTLNRWKTNQKLREKSAMIDVNMDFEKYDKIAEIAEINKLNRNLQGFRSLRKSFVSKCIESGFHSPNAIQEDKKSNS